VKKRPSEGGETTQDQPVDSEIVIDPLEKSPFGLIGQKIHGVLGQLPEPGLPLDSEATRPGTEVDPAIARSGKRIEQTMDYVGHKVHDLLHVPPPEPFISSEATRPGSEVNVPLARVGKRIEEYLHAATHTTQVKAWQETSTALHEAADTMDRAPLKALETKASAVGDQVSATSSAIANKTSETMEDASKWTKEAKDSLVGAAQEYSKPTPAGDRAAQRDEQDQRAGQFYLETSSGSEQTATLKRAQSAPEVQSARVSAAKQQPRSAQPRYSLEPQTGAPIKAETLWSRVSNWFSGGKDK